MKYICQICLDVDNHLEILLFIFKKGLKYIRQKVSTMSIRLLLKVLMVKESLICWGSALESNLGDGSMRSRQEEIKEGGFARIRDYMRGAIGRGRHRFLEPN